MSIFKAYDIRGTYPDQLNEELIYKIGKAFHKVIGGKDIVVGHDMRKSSIPLKDSLVKGLTESGANVILIGEVTTPMMYFTVGKFKYDAGIMITASHNPSQYNGLKMVRADAVPIGGETGIMDIEKAVMDGKFPPPSKIKGKVTQKDVYDEYIKSDISSTNLKGLRHFNIVIDTANAMGGPVASKFFRKLDVELTHLYPELDGSFPNHEANPLKFETLKKLQETVRQKKADFGVAFDGDADRVAFVDEKGEIVQSDLMTALIAKIILEENPGAKIMDDVRSSKIVGEVVRANGGIPVRCRVGHSLIKTQMRQENGFFGGELSGHYYYKPNFYIESPFILILKLMKLLTEDKRPFSEHIKPLRKYSQSGEINSDVKDKDAKMKELATKFKDAKNIFWLDGVTVEYDDWWFNVRPSNTEPLLRLNLEADSKAKMEKMRDKVLAIIRT